MISTFDLMLLGSLVSAGGLLFLRHGKRSYLNWSSLGMAKRPCELSAESRQQHARSTALAAARWLTVGVLTLFIAYVHGAEEGYLFGPWSDVMLPLGTTAPPFFLPDVVSKQVYSLDSFHVSTLVCERR